MPRRWTVTTLFAIVSLAVLGGVGVVSSSAHARTVTKSGYCRFYNSEYDYRSVKSKYCLTVTVAGVPTTVTLNQQYTYSMSIKNTGKKAIPKVMVAIHNERFLVSASVPYSTILDTDASSGAIFKISNLRAGSTKRINMAFVYNEPALAGGKGVPIGWLVRGGKSICLNSSCAGTVVQLIGKKISYFRQQQEP